MGGLPLRERWAIRKFGFSMLGGLSAIVPDVFFPEAIGLMDIRAGSDLVLGSRSGLRAGSTAITLLSSLVW